MGCLFCKLRDQNAGKHVFEDDRAFVLQDLHPQAPTHLLVLPKKHIPGPAAIVPGSAAGSGSEDEAIVGHLVAVAAELARVRGIEQSGYRLVLNCNQHGGQTVFHLHIHLLGGRQMQWPPG